MGLNKVLPALVAVTAHEVGPFDARSVPFALTVHEPETLNDIAPPPEPPAVVKVIEELAFAVVTLLEILKAA